MFKYIISGNGYKALAVHSSLNWIEFKEYLRLRSERIHPEGTDTVFNLTSKRNPLPLGGG